MDDQKKLSSFQLRWTKKETIKRNPQKKQVGLGSGSAFDHCNIYFTLHF